MDQRGGHGYALAHAFGIFGDQFFPAAVQLEQVQQFDRRVARELRSRP